MSMFFVRVRLSYMKYVLPNIPDVLCQKFHRVVNCWEFWTETAHWWKRIVLDGSGMAFFRSKYCVFNFTIWSHPFWLILPLKLIFKKMHCANLVKNILVFVLSVSQKNKRLPGSLCIVPLLLPPYVFYVMRTQEKLIKRNEKNLKKFATPQCYNLQVYIMLEFITFY